MRQPLFNPEERAVIRNLDLLTRASQQLISSGVADEIYPRLGYCICSYADELGLQLGTCDSTTDGIDDPDTSGARDDDVVDAEVRSSLQWPDGFPNLSWIGIKGPKRLFPTLVLSFRGNVGDLFRPDGIELSIDYGRFSMAIRSRPTAVQLARKYKLLPTDHLWYNFFDFHDLRIHGELPIRRYESPWWFHARCLLPEFRWVDATALLHGRKPPPLIRVAPRIATLLQEYVQICSRFSEMQVHERLSLKRPRVTPLPMTPYTLKQIKLDDENQFLREHATEVLEASRMYSEDFQLSEPGMIVGEVVSAEFVETEKRYDSIRERLVRLIKKAVAKKCDTSMKSFDRPRVDDDPNIRVPRGTRLEPIRDNKCWGQGDGSIRLAVRLVVPDGVNKCSFELEVAVYLNPLVRGRSAAALKVAERLWMETGAECFTEWADVQWTLSKPRTSGRFWGYRMDEPVTVDMERLAEEDRNAISGLDPVIKAFLSASKKVEQSFA